MELKLSATRWIMPAFIGIFIIWSIVVYARSSGITGRTLLSSTTPGCTCHNNDFDPSVTVSINGPNELEINQSASYEVTISGGPLAAGGINIAASGGTLSTVDGTLQKSGSELTHTNPLAPSGGQVKFLFDVTAPAFEGSVTLAATGNSVNLADGNSGDAWNHAANKWITILNPSAIAGDDPVIPELFSLSQNYPNPFNPSTSIQYNLKEGGNVSLQVYDILGRNIASLVNERKGSGQHQAVFDGTNLESGTYYYVLNSGGNTQSRKMVLLK